MNTEEAHYKKKTLLEQTTALLPLVSILCLGYGVINKLVFYGHFGINIFEYIEVSELLLHTVNHLILIGLPILFLPVILFIYGIRNDKKTSGFTSEQILTYNQQYFLKIAKRKRRIYWMWSISFGITAVAQLYFYLNNLFNLSVFVLHVFCIISSLFFLLICDYIDAFFIKVLGFKSTIKMFSLISLIYVLGTFAVGTALFRIANLTYGSSLNSYIIIKGKVIKSTINYYYIGKTKENIFFYNVKSEMVDTFFQRDVESMSLR